LSPAREDDSASRFDVTVLESRIIERASGEVNGRPRLPRALAAPLAAMLAVLLAVLALSCSREAGAQRLLDEARGEVKRERLPEAVALLERVTKEYAGTPAAARAEKDLILYRGLLQATRLDPLRRARDLLVQTARQLERAHGERGSWPEALGTAVLDPWGRPLVYERTARGYRLACWGADGSPGGEPDLVVVNGRFQQDPLEGSP
jgi:hypothetical protein